MGVLLVADHDNAALNAATAKTMSAAQAIDTNVDILVAGKGCAGVADAAAAISGAARVLLADASHLEHHLAEDMAALIEPLAKQYDAILAPATTCGKNYMPRLAALLDVAQISDITAVISADTFERPIYAGNAMQSVQSLDAIKIITVRATTFPAAEANGSAAIETIDAGAPCGLSQFGGDELSSSDRPELTAARVVVSGGRALGSAENFSKYIEPLAGQLNAAVGASRAAVDAGYVPNDYQVGQTGKVVAPELYIAIGISGAIQHLAGMKDSKVIVAINKDEEAPIFQIADYGLVGDLFVILPELQSELEKLAP
ncbi:MAG: electron transfer flavoprotein subunit alpha/FixB family protein [Proteobacteria bacterium]|nr:electron transfer flavoprotein subunit alpha/FixB family protein [Pseudomonadota bacterium]